MKVDTNGSRPDVVKNLVDGGLVDFVSLDFKAPSTKFKKVTRSSLYDPFVTTLQCLIGSQVSHIYGISHRL